MTQLHVSFGPWSNAFQVAPDLVELCHHWLGLFDTKPLSNPNLTYYHPHTTDQKRDINDPCRMNISKPKHKIPLYHITDTVVVIMSLINVISNFEIFQCLYFHKTIRRNSWGSSVF